MLLLTITAPRGTESRRQLFKIQLTPQKKREQRTEPAEKEKGEKEEPIICAYCSAAITSSSQAIAVNDRHEHAFFNPAGIAFEIRCFRQAPGCLVEGEPTTEFSWFDGCSWQLAACSNCLGQLGWFFQTLGKKKSFFGLISNKIL